MRWRWKRYAGAAGKLPAGRHTVRHSLWYCGKLRRRGPTTMKKADAAGFLLCLLASSISIVGAEQLKPGASRDAIQTYLNRTADAVLALKSTRFSIKREGTPAVL